MQYKNISPTVKYIQSNLYTVINKSFEIFEKMYKTTSKKATLYIKLLKIWFQQNKFILKYNLIFLYKATLYIKDGLLGWSFIEV